MARAYPRGWFRIAPAAALDAATAQSVRCAGRELTLSRAPSGLPVLCDRSAAPHPSHSDRWPACTWQGQVMMYASDDRRAPEWSLPTLDPHGWTRPRWTTLSLLGHIEDIAENGVDVAHFSAVHGYRNVRDVLIEERGSCLHSRFAFDRAHPLSARLGTISSVFDTDIFGLGCSITDLYVRDLRLHCRLLLLATQLDATHMDFTIGMSVELPERVRAGQLARLWRFVGEQLLLRFLLRATVGDVLQDQEIWAHRKYLSRPALTARDRPIKQFRSFAKQFYV